MLKIQIIVAKYLVPASVLNFMAAWLQAAVAADMSSILGVAAVVNALLSFGLLGGALTLAYGYGSLNNQVNNIIKTQTEERTRIEEFINRLEESNERRSTRIWDELKRLNESVGKLKGRDEILTQIAQLNTNNRVIPVKVDD